MGRQFVYPLLGFTIIFIGVAAYTADTKCTRKFACPSGQCTESVVCIHGECTENGFCECRPCWAGDACDRYENINQPYFSPDKPREVVLSDGPKDGEHIFTAVAYDDDENEKNFNSPCVNVIYGFSGNNGDSLFTINSTTGVVHIKSAKELKENRYKVKITARNEQDVELSDYVASLDLTVIVRQEGLKEMVTVAQEDESYAHHRHKRAAPVPTEAIPDNVTFTIYKMGKYENVTTMKVGEKVSTRLMIHFPVQTTDMVVELFTPLNQTTIMKLCNPVISHVGSNLENSFNQTHAQFVLDAQDGSSNYDRAVVDLGEITNDGTDTGDYAASMIYIDFNAVLIASPDIVNATKQWVSAGAAYNNQGFIWVGQAAFETILDPMEPPRAPTFNLSGPTQMELDSSAVFTVDMFISHPSTEVRIDAFAPLNTTSVMSVCGITVKDTADHYSCLPTDTYKASMSTAESGIGNWHGKLDLGTITNSGSRENDAIQADDRITVAIMARLTGDNSIVNDVHNFGVAVEVGDLIWVAEAPLTVVSPTPVTELAINPVFTINPKTGLDAYINRPTVIELDMVIPENTESIYELEVVTPTNETLDFKICGISVIYRGDNLLCIPDSPAAYYMDDNSTSTNRAVLMLGRVKNMGMKSSTLANTVRFEVVVQALNTTDYTIGEKYWVTMGMTLTDTKIWVGQQAVFVQESDVAEIQENPTFKMEYAFGSEYVVIGDTREILYKMWTTPKAVYVPAYIEVIMPDNITSNGTRSPLFSICDVKIVSVGKNVPCLNATESSETVEYETKFDSSKRNKGKLNLNYICNTGMHSDADENMIVLSVIVKVEDHDYLQNGTMDFISVGIMLTNKTMWVGQVGLFALREDVPAINPNAVAPYVGIEMTSNLTGDVPMGYILLYTVNIKIPTQTSMRYELNVTSQSSEVSVCGLRIITSGDHLPCIDKTLRPTYEDYPETTLHKMAYINFGPITSHGPKTWDMISSNEFAADTIRLELAVRLSTNAGAVAGSHSFDAVLTSSDGKVATDTASFTGTTATLDISSNDTVLEPPMVNFYMVDVYDILLENTTFEIGRGEAKRFITEVILKEPFVAPLEVKFFTPLNNSGADVEVCQAQILSIGDNIPCLQKSDVITSYEKRSGVTVTDVASLNLGYVCLFPSEPVTNDTNKIRLEGIMKVSKDTTLTSAKVTTSVRIGDTYIILTDLPLTIMENITMKEFGYINETNATLPSIEYNVTTENMTVGEVITIPVLVSVPANSSGEVIVDMKLEVNDSAHMTVQDMRVISAGGNLACLRDFSDVDYDYRSSQNTSQNDFGIISIGLVTNSGFSYRSGKHEDAEDQILVEFDVQMADSILNEDESWHEISVAMKYGGVIVLLSHYIQVLRNNDEKPELEIIANFNLTDPLSRSDTLLINAVMKHLNTSTAEGINVTANFYLPPYVTFMTLNYSNLEATADLADGSIVRVEFPQVYFTDIVFFGILLQVLSNASTPFSMIDAITPYEAGATMYYRPDSIFTSGEFFTTELKDVSYMVTAMAATGCNSALGMEDGRIQDCQIRGSVAPNPSALPVDGRLNGGSVSGWSPFRRGGKFGEHRYLEVYFGNKTKVTTVRLKHMGVALSKRPTQLQVFYSDEGKTWFPGDKIIPTNPNAYTEVDMPVITPRESRYIRLYILTSEVDGTDLLGIQVEFYGCSTTSDIQDPCPSSTPTASEYTERSFLYGGTHVYSCDADPNNDLAVSCISSSDGNEWRVLDKSVSNVIGYLPTTDEIFAVGTDKVSYMNSLDNGETWSCILKETWNKASVDVNFIFHKPVPWTQDTKLTGVNPHTDYIISGIWGAKDDGLYFYDGSTWNMRVNWNCC